MVNPTISHPNLQWKFRGHGYVFHEDGSQIDPSSSEGKMIQLIWDVQDDVKIMNRDQKIHWVCTTYPNDLKKRTEFFTQFGIDPNTKCTSH